MPDVFTKTKRSQIMSRIRGCGNKGTELALIRVLRAHRITGWRRHQDIFGQPDFVFREVRVALFVDGCFWHGCPICYTRPKSKRVFWDAKLTGNRARDRLVGRELRKLGWRVLRIWEHDLRKHPGRVIAQVLRALATTG